MATRRDRLARRLAGGVRCADWPIDTKPDRGVWTALILAAVVALTVAATGFAGSATTERLSVSSSGEQANDHSYTPAISADGRYVAYVSDASNLVAEDTNGAPDVFVRDRKLDTTSRVSVSSTGHQGNGDSGVYGPAISADGRYVAFTSKATNLVSGDTNGRKDVFVRDRKLHKTRRVSVSSSGRQGYGASFNVAISADGRYVAFSSLAPNLVAGDVNKHSDVFVRDRKRHTTRRVSVSSAGRQGNAESFGPAISADGRYVAFESRASNFAARDRHGTYDVFVRDRKLHKTRMMSVSSTGNPGNSSSENPAISADGHYVAFDSYATNLVSGDTNGEPDAFLRDRKRHTTSRVNVSSTGAQGDGFGGGGAISAHGRYVAFDSGASNLTAGDTNATWDVFVRDRKLDTTSRVSVSSTGAQGNGLSAGSAISADGHYVAFGSKASNFVGGDTNRKWDVFVHGPLP